jgi:hypothetical protein
MRPLHSTLTILPSLLILPALCTSCTHAISLVESSSPAPQVILRSDIGLGEAYMDGDYEVYGSFRSDGTKEHLSDGLYSFLEILSRAGANPPQAKTSLGVVGGWLHGTL